METRSGWVCLGLRMELGLRTKGPEEALWVTEMSLNWLDVMAAHIPHFLRTFDP